MSNEPRSIPIALIPPDSSLLYVRWATQTRRTLFFHPFLYLMQIGAYVPLPPGAAMDVFPVLGLVIPYMLSFLVTPPLRFFWPPLVDNRSYLSAPYAALPQPADRLTLPFPRGLSLTGGPFGPPLFPFFFAAVETKTFLPMLLSCPACGVHNRPFSLSLFPLPGAAGGEIP